MRHFSIISKIAGDRMPDPESLYRILQEALSRRKAVKLIPPQPLKDCQIITTGNMRKIVREAEQRKREAADEKKRSGLIAKYKKLLEQIRRLEGNK